MEPARSIGKIGFRRWDERRLIESHAWLVTSLLCALAISVALEALNFRESSVNTVITIAFCFVGGLFSWHGLRQYGSLMRQAETLAEHSRCGSCREYDKFHMVGEYPTMTVRCRKCGNQWDLDPERRLRD
jgi:hypothetical protein